jgi:hypothetical protein
MNATIIGTKDKTQSYTKQTPGDDFIPLAIEIYGCFHLCFDSFFISCLHANIACYQETCLIPSMFISHYRQQMSIALKCVQVIMIFQQALTFTHNLFIYIHIVKYY